jgi:lipid-A-disaccharide synthase-like uncharacterized protein
MGGISAHVLKSEIADMRSVTRLMRARGALTHLDALHFEIRWRLEGVASAELFSTRFALM